MTQSNIRKLDMSQASQESHKDLKQLNKFEYWLLALHLNVSDLPLEAKHLTGAIELIGKVKEAHEEAIREAETTELSWCHANLLRLQERDDMPYLLADPTRDIEKRLQHLKTRKG